MGILKNYIKMEILKIKFKDQNFEKNYLKIKF